MPKILKIKLCLMIIIGSIFSTSAGMALTTVITPELSEQARLKQEQLMQENQNRLNYADHLKQEQQLKKEKPQIYQETVIAPIESDENLPSFNIEIIELKGFTKLGTENLKQRVVNYEHKKLNINQINQLVADLTNYYIEEGYVTTRVFVPENQNLKNGRLILQIQEGSIEDLRAEGLSDWQKFLAFQNANDRMLDIRALEQGLDQLNRLGSNKATMKLVPSTTQIGQTVVLIQNEQNKKANLSAQYDILSDPRIQLLPNSLNLSYDNLLNSLDQLQLTYSQRYQDRMQFQNSLSLSGSIPFSYLTFSGFYNELNYVTLIEDLYSYQTTSGTSKTVKIAADLVVNRSGLSKNSWQMELLSKDSQNFVEDTLNEPASRKLTILSAGIQQSWYLPSGTLVGDLKYVKGLTFFNALRDDSSTKEKAQFSKMTGELNWNTVCIFGTFPVSLRERFAGQYSWDSLYSSEQFSIGDFSSVRGFETSFAGDLGALNSFKVLYPIDKCPVWVTPYELLKSFLGDKVSVYHQLDVGAAWLWGEFDNPTSRACMASFTNGFMYQDESWSMDFGLSKGFLSSSNIPIPNVIAYFSVTKILF